MFVLIWEEREREERGLAGKVEIVDVHFAYSPLPTNEGKNPTTSEGNIATRRDMYIVRQK